MEPFGKWGKVFKTGLSKVFKAYLPQNLLSPLLNILLQIQLQAVSYLCEKPPSLMIDMLKQPPEVFCKKGVVRNFAKFKVKHLCQSLFFNKVVHLRPTTLLKRDPGTGVFL